MGRFVLAVRNYDTQFAGAGVCYSSDFSRNTVWTISPSFPCLLHVEKMAYYPTTGGAGIFIATGTNTSWNHGQGKFGISTNGENWEDKTKVLMDPGGVVDLGSHGSILGFVYAHGVGPPGGGRLIICARSKGAFYSDDLGDSWTKCSGLSNIETGEGAKSICWNENASSPYFVLAGITSSGSYNLATSSDGITFTTYIVPDFSVGGINYCGYISSISRWWLCSAPQVSNNNSSAAMSSSSTPTSSGWVVIHRAYGSGDTYFLQGPIGMVHAPNNKISTSSGNGRLILYGPGAGGNGNQTIMYHDDYTTTGDTGWVRCQSNIDGTIGFNTYAPDGLFETSCRDIIWIDDFNCFYAVGAAKKGYNDVFGGFQNSLAYSSDGITWVNAGMPMGQLGFGFSDLMNVVYSPTASGTTYQQIKTVAGATHTGTTYIHNTMINSLDGKNFTEIGTTGMFRNTVNRMRWYSSSTLKNPALPNGVWIAVGGDYYNVVPVAYSYDGVHFCASEIVTWHEPTDTSMPAMRWNECIGEGKDIAFNGSTFLVVGCENNFSNKSIAICDLSMAGAMWWRVQSSGTNQGEYGAPADLTACAWGPVPDASGLFVIAGRKSDNKLKTSWSLTGKPDTWSVGTGFLNNNLDQNCHAISWVKDKFFAVGDFGIATSTDGMAWSQTSSQQSNNLAIAEPKDIASNGDVVIAVGLKGSGSHTMMISTDAGDSWTGKSLIFSEAGLSITYNQNDSWTAGGGDNATIMYSEDNGENWSSVTNSTTLFNTSVNARCTALAGGMDVFHQAGGGEEDPIVDGGGGSETKQVYDFNTKSNTYSWVMNAYNITGVSGDDMIIEVPGSTNKINLKGNTELDNNLSVTGSVTVGGSEVHSSDDRMKHNELLITNGLEIIRKLEPQIYQKTKTFKTPNYYGTLTEPYILEAGLIAQEVGRIPELLHCMAYGDWTKPYGVKYNDIFVYGLAATKELDKIVEGEKILLNDLSGRISNIIQGNITSIGAFEDLSMSGNINLNNNNINNINNLNANNLTGILKTEDQTNIKLVGRLKDLMMDGTLNLCNNNIINGDVVIANTLIGKLDTICQDNIKVLGGLVGLTMEGNINLNGNNISNGITIQANNFIGDINGNATTASKLKSAINLAGVLFDGESDINLPGVDISGTQNTTGNAATSSKLEIGRNIGGVLFDGGSDINLPGVNISGNQNTSGNAATASKLEYGRYIGGVLFNGESDINLPGVDISGNQNTTGNAETSSLCLGNSATATKLENVRIIAGAMFDGSEDISINYNNLTNLPTIIPTPWNEISSNIYYNNGNVIIGGLQNKPYKLIIEGDTLLNGKTHTSIIQPTIGNFANGNIALKIEQNSISSNVADRYIKLYNSPNELVELKMGSSLILSHKNGCEQNIEGNNSGNLYWKGYKSPSSNDLNNNKNCFYPSMINETSDDRCKHNESNINGLDIIRKLTAYKYNKTEEIYDIGYSGSIDLSSSLIETGFIAQDISTNCPELNYLINGGDYLDGVNQIKEKHTIRYKDIFVYNCEATKELDSKVKLQQTIIGNLTNRIIDLQNKNAEITTALNILLSEAGKNTI